MGGAAERYGSGVTGRPNGRAPGAVLRHSKLVAGQPSAPVVAEMGRYAYFFGDSEFGPAWGVFTASVASTKNSSKLLNWRRRS